MGLNTQEIQRTYANTLHWIAITGFIFLVISFLIYVLAIVPPMVDPSTIPAMWHLPADEFVEQNSLATGWKWTHHVLHGDMIAMSSLFFLASGTIICFFVVSVLFIRERQWPYAVFSIIEIVVLVSAAYGVASGVH